MSTHASSQVFAIRPSSLLSVLRGANRDGSNNHTDRHVEIAQTVELKEPSAAHGGLLSPRTTGNPFSLFHQHRDSTSTSASDSTDSSPTTTVSTMDSPSVTEPSPGPSPESPPSKEAQSALAGQPTRLQTPNGSSVSPCAFFELQRPSTPAKKARNLKNLAVKTASTFPSVRAISTASLPLATSAEPQSASAPASPSFVKPPTPPRRRPNNLGLTIKTPAHPPSGPRDVRLVIPPTPGLTRPNTLRHFQSSPSLPLCSPHPDGPENPWMRASRPAPSGLAEVLQENEDEDQEPNFDVPQSREDKPAAYPNGPICIYESGVFLYFEPTAEQASDYDVILNVASEVKNPFQVKAELASLAQRADSVHSEQAVSATSEGVTPMDESPSTPKADPLPGMVTVAASPGAPEYIHIPWEHNADIVPDLYRLVKLIDDRVQNRKRVLVHCQCGVSRSASLIVAYGLYKNPGVSVQDAYDAVKKRSKWIGPNMNLIMQLQEFRAGLLKAASDPAYYSKVFGMPKSLTPNLASGPMKSGKRSPAFDAVASPVPDPPLSAPFSSGLEANSQLMGAMNLGAVSPGPSSAPSSFVWSPRFRRSWGPSPPTSDMSPSPLSISSATPYVNTKGQLLPTFESFEEQQQQPPKTKVMDVEAAPPALPAPVLPSVALPVIHQEATVPEADGPEADPFGLMSPHATSFPKNPFDRTFLTVHSAEAQPPHQPAPMPSSAQRSASSERHPRSTLSAPSRRDRSEPPARARDSTKSRKALRPKFSSPNLQQQFQMHKIQSGLESLLPGRSPQLPDVRDEQEALKSPRATEFTVNPFHLALDPPEQTSHPEVLASCASAESAVVDPRSPAYKGISPITRNIWDVL